jgi:carbon monoxide dehydrogenase subunit G
MPETTETATFDRPPEDVFAHLADFSRIAEWDPMFERSERLDTGPLGVGSRFRVVGSALGRDIELEIETVTYEAPNHVVIHGHGETLTTAESIRVEPNGDGGSEVTWTASYDTQGSGLVDAMTTPAFVLAGKNTIKGMRRWLTG